MHWDSVNETIRKERIEGMEGFSNDVIHKSIKYKSMWCMET